jgi:hypothetical protein
MEEFVFDVFLSHSAKEKDLTITDWKILTDDSLSLSERTRVREEKTEAGLVHSRVLVLCLSANANGSDTGRDWGGG